MNERNLTMLTDFYELTMANGFLGSGNGDRIVYFDMFFRRVPDNGGLAIMAGAGPMHCCKGLFKPKHSRKWSFNSWAISLAFASSSCWKTSFIMRL